MRYYLECLNCNELMDLVEEEEDDIMKEYHECSKCHNKVAITKVEVRE